MARSDGTVGETKENIFSVPNFLFPSFCAPDSFASSEGGCMNSFVRVSIVFRKFLALKCARIRVSGPAVKSPADRCFGLGREKIPGRVYHIHALHFNFAPSFHFSSPPPFRSPCDVVHTTQRIDPLLLPDARVSGPAVSLPASDVPLPRAYQQHYSRFYRLATLRERLARESWRKRAAHRINRPVVKLAHVYSCQQEYLNRYVVNSNKPCRAQSQKVSVGHRRAVVLFSSKTPRRWRRFISDFGSACLFPSRFSAALVLARW